LMRSVVVVSIVHRRNKLRRAVRVSFTALSHPRDLHSFPTRRSSDLEPPIPRQKRRLTAKQNRQRQKPYPTSGRSGARSTSHCRRSEEHTSELQSRENLVCRLLLEKKKI